MLLYILLVTIILWCHVTTVYARMWSTTAAVYRHFFPFSLSFGKNDAIKVPCRQPVQIVNKVNFSLNLPGSDQRAGRQAGKGQLDHLAFQTHFHKLIHKHKLCSHQIPSRIWICDLCTLWFIIHNYICIICSRLMLHCMIQIITSYSYVRPLSQRRLRGECVVM